MRRRKRKRKMCKREFGKEEEMRKTDLFLEEKKNEDMSQARKETWLKIRQAEKKSNSFWYSEF